MSGWLAPNKGWKRRTVACALAMVFATALPVGAPAQGVGFPTPVTFILHNGRTDAVQLSITDSAKIKPFDLYQISMYPGQVDLIQQWLDGGPEGNYGRFLVRFHSVSAPSQNYCQWSVSASRSAKFRSWICDVKLEASQEGSECEGQYGKDWQGTCYFHFTVK